jgi:hypothetical protein
MMDISGILDISCLYFGEGNNSLFIFFILVLKLLKVVDLLSIVGGMPTFKNLISFS